MSARSGEKRSQADYSSLPVAKRAAIADTAHPSLQPVPSTEEEEPASCAEELDLKILRFQNRQLAARLRRHKQAAKGHAATIERLDGEHAARLNTLAALCQYWDQWEREVAAALDAVSPGEPGANGKAGESRLLHVLASDAAADVADRELKVRKEAGTRLAKRIAAIAAKAAAPAQADGAAPAPQPAPAEATAAALAAESRAEKAEAARLVADRQLAESKGKVESLTFQLEKARNKAFRLQDLLTATEGKCGELMHSVDSLNAAASSASEAAAAADVSGAPGCAPAQPAAASEEVQAELALWQSRAESRMGEIKKLEEELAGAQSREMRLRHKTLTEEEIRQTAVYQSVWSAYRMNEQRADKAQEQVHVLSDKLTQSEAARREDIARLEELDRSRATKLDKLVLDFKTTLTKAVQERDALERQQKLAATKSKSSADELQTMVKALDSHNKNLKAEIARLRAGDASGPSGDAEGDSEQLKAALKASEEREKELKLLLDVFRKSAKDLRDKDDLLVSERRLQDQVTQLEGELAKLGGSSSANRAAAAAQPGAADSKVVEELQQALKSQEEALVAELEDTGLAFEEMQEQNARLLKQLSDGEARELKLMAERLKSTQQYSIVCEEKRLMLEKQLATQVEVDKQATVIEKLKTHGQAVQTALIRLESLVREREQVIEKEQRVAAEKTQVAWDRKLQLDKCAEELNAVRDSLEDSLKQAQAARSKLRRVTEESTEAQRRLERMGNPDADTTVDEILKAQVQDLQKQLTCPICNSRKKDTIFLKCFHVFCGDCVKTRYDTRQRKCPQCSLPFGRQDFHQIFL